MSTPDNGLAHNDEYGNAYCHLCDWTAGPYTSFEMVEAAIVGHLGRVHGLAVRYAVEHGSGTVRATPQQEGGE